MTQRKSPAQSGYRIWLVEQELTRLHGEYLTEAMIVARTEPKALDAAVSLADTVTGFGLTVQRSRLRAFDYGAAPDPLPTVHPRHRHADALVLVIGVGADLDRPVSD